jgi:hypothetical protein
LRLQTKEPSSAAEGDRVTLTNRYLSTIEEGVSAILRNVSPTYELFRTWWQNDDASVDDSLTTTVSASGIPSRPSLRDPLPRWLYVEAWRDSLKWRAQTHLCVRTRTKNTMKIELDTAPISCAYACIRLGLSECLFASDRSVCTNYIVT